MNRSASLALIASLTPVELCALRFIPLFQATFAFFMIAQENGYPIGF